MLTRLLSILILLVTPVLSARADVPDYRIQTLAEGLSHPWSMAFLPDGRLLVTERDGRLRLIKDGRLHPEPVAGVPKAYVASQGGLFDILPHPDWDNNGWLYLSLAHGDRSASTTRLVRGRLDGHRLVAVEVLFDAEPARNTPVHYGGRMAWLPDGTLVLGLGDGFEYREEAQNPANHLGTLVRLTDNGGIPPDNPLSEGKAARPEVFSYGHRNIQGLAYDPDTDRLWATEHGPRGGDELNIIRPGANYGWPAASHGVDYSGALVTPHKSLPGMEDPTRTWTPAIAPAGLMQYRGRQFPEWEGDLFIPALAARAIIHLAMDGSRIIGESRRFTEIGERLRDIRTGPDGAIYILTDSEQGKLLKISRAGP